MGIETLTLPSEYNKNIFTLRVTEHWKQVVQWGYGVSLTRDIPNLPGYDPFKLLKVTLFRGPFELQPYCDFATTLENG